MVHLITIIIPLNNRHQNLDRLLHYYNDFNFPIIVADSSKDKHQFASIKENISYIHTPGKNFNEKIELHITSVKTPYVVICADDDFIIPESLFECVSFLEKNKDYSIAQGNCVCFMKNSITSSQIDYRPLYKNVDFSIEDDVPLKRVKRMFDPYRSVVYAVHRTENLTIAYKNAGTAFKNLYLNEYLTAFVPIAKGKYKELPFLYQVREFAEDSDDKTTDNLDKIFSDDAYEGERNAYLNFLTNSIHQAIGEKKEAIESVVRDSLKYYAESLKLLAKGSKSVKKKIGSIINKVPFLGDQIIAKNRKIERKRALSKVVRNDEIKHLDRISQILKMYS